MKKIKNLFVVLGVFCVLLTHGQGGDFFQSDKENRWVDSVYSAMTLEERISQLIFVRAITFSDQSKNDSLDQVIQTLKPGGVVLFAGEPIAQANLINRLQEKSNVPLLVSLDGEWGLGMRFENTTSFPYQMALGAIQKDTLLYEMGTEIARQFKRMGIHINFAPVVDVNNNPANPVINYRSFGESPSNVASKGLAYALGLQEHGVLPTAKHFPGHGDTDVDSHLALPVISHDESRLNEVELFPFKHLVKNGINGIMVAHLNIPAWDGRPNYPSSLSKPMISGILREQLGFDGLIFTDALEMKGITAHFPSGEAAVEAFKAGNDILLLPENTAEAISKISNEIKNKGISDAELESRVRKVLKVKYRTGLKNKPSIRIENLLDDLNNPAAEVLNRKLIEHSITVIADEQNLVPLRDLHLINIASVSVGADQITPFQDRLGSYSAVEHFTVRSNADEQAINDLKSQLLGFDVVIIGVHDNQSRPRNTNQYSSSVMEFLNVFPADKKTIITSFRNPYTLSDQVVAPANALITTYFDSPLTEDLAAQVIFGAIGARGRLPVSVNDTYPVETGIDTEGGLRLKYTIPEEIGISSQKLAERIGNIVQLGLDSAAYPGAQVLFAKDGKVFFHETYGYHTYDKTKEVKRTDIYDFASVTKITGPLPALMQLHDQGKFHLDARLQDYVPYMKRSNKGELDWRNILAHNARLKSWIAYWTTTLKKNGKYKRKTLSNTYSDDFPIVLKEGLYEHKDYEDKIYKMIKKAPMNEKPGYLYSGLSFYLYPKLITDMTGQDYEGYVKNNIYKRLGAYTLTFNPAEHFDLDRIVPTENDTFFRKMQIHGVVHDEGAAMMKGVSGNAGLFGTANDLAKLIQMYQNMGEFGGDRYISEATMNKFTSCQYCELGNHRGLGFDKPLITNRENGTPAPSASSASFGHTGYTGTFTWADPETGILIVFFSNRVYPTRYNTKLYSLNIRPQLHQTVYDLLGY